MGVPSLYIVSAIKAGGYIFNDSINVDISITMKDGSGNDTTYTFSDIGRALALPTRPLTAALLASFEDDLLDFQKISLIDLSEHEMGGKDSLIISYTFSDHAGNYQNYNIKINLIHLNINYHLHLCRRIRLGFLVSV